MARMAMTAPPLLPLAFSSLSFHSLFLRSRYLYEHRNDVIDIKTSKMRKKRRRQEAAKMGSKDLQNDDGRTNLKNSPASRRLPFPSLSPSLSPTPLRPLFKTHQGRQRRACRAREGAPRRPQGQSSNDRRSREKSKKEGKRKCRPGDDTTAVPAALARRDNNQTQNPQAAEIALGGEEAWARGLHRRCCCRPGIVVAQTASNAEGATFPPPPPRGAPAAAGAVPGTAEEAEEEQRRRSTTRTCSRWGEEARASRSTQQQRQRAGAGAAVGGRRAGGRSSSREQRQRRRREQRRRRQRERQ